MKTKLRKKDYYQHPNDPRAMNYKTKQNWRRKRNGTLIEREGLTINFNSRDETSTSLYLLKFINWRRFELDVEEKLTEENTHTHTYIYIYIHNRIPKHTRIPKQYKKRWVRGSLSPSNNKRSCGKFAIFFLSVFVTISSLP